MSGLQGGKTADTVAHDRAHEEGRSAAVPTPDQMAVLGITRVPVDVFHFREYRYSNLADAVEEATRYKLAEGARKAAGQPTAGTTR